MGLEVRPDAARSAAASPPFRACEVEGHQPVLFGTRRTASLPGDAWIQPVLTRRRGRRGPGRVPAARPGSKNVAARGCRLVRALPHRPSMREPGARHPFALRAPSPTGTTCRAPPDPPRLSPRLRRTRGSRERSPPPSPPHSPSSTSCGVPGTRTNWSVAPPGMSRQPRYWGRPPRRRWRRGGRVQVRTQDLPWFGQLVRAMSKY